MSTFRPEPQCAIGNFSILMATHVGKSIFKNEKFYFHEDIKKYGRDLMLVLPPTVDTDVPVNNGNGVLGGFLHFKVNTIPQLMQLCIIPSKILLDSYINPYYEKVSDCKTAFHIRMGRNAKDSYKFARYGTANHIALDTMIEEANKLDEPVFVSSDSETTKKYFMARVPKAKCLDIEIGFTSDEHSQNQICEDETIHSKMNSMAEWFILSKMKKIYTTMGGPGCGSSTFGFSAAMYGGVAPHYVFNDGTILDTNVPPNDETGRLYQWFEA